MLHFAVITLSSHNKQSFDVQLMDMPALVKYKVIKNGEPLALKIAIKALGCWQNRMIFNIVCVFEAM